MIVLIPARVGSKGVALKNIRMLGGFPLVAWSIAAGRLLGYPTVVSSDSDEILDVANKYVDTRHKRSVGSSDIQTDIEVVADFIRCWQYDEIIYLRPTTPFRNPVLLKEAVGLWKQSIGWSCLCSGHILPESADKLLKFGMSKFVPYNESVRLEDIHNPRQSATETIQTNGVIDIFKTDRVSEGILWGKNMLGFITPKTIEIDEPEDLEYANWWLSKYGHPLWDYLKAVYGK